MKELFGTTAKLGEFGVVSDNLEATGTVATTYLSFLVIVEDVKRIKANLKRIVPVLFVHILHSQRSVLLKDQQLFDGHSLQDPITFVGFALPSQFLVQIECEAAN